MFTTTTLIRIVLYTIAWLGLTGGVGDSWQVGLPAVAAAVWLDCNLTKPEFLRWSPTGWLVYALSFFKFSITGGFDVLRRTFHPQLPLNPGMISYRLQLTSLSARLLFTCTISLLPGTLAVQLEEHEIKVHVLDVNGPFEEELAIIEKRVAAIFQTRPGPLQTGGGKTT